MNTAAFPLTLLAMVVALLSSAMSQAATATEAESDFKWFSGLGFPDVKDRRLVRVATGLWSQSGNHPRQNRYVTGFLLAEEGTRFTVLALDLTESRLTNSLPGTAEHERVGFEPLDLKAYAAAQLGALRQEPGDEDRWQRFGERLAQRSEVFVFAWACWRNGLTNEAGGLYAAAASLPARYQREAGDARFRMSVERDLAHALMWRAIGSFGDPAVPRRDLLAMFTTLERSYKLSEHHPRATATAACLRRMLAEDEAHRTPTAEALARLPVETQVKEWVFRLRDQTGHQWGQPGSCDIFTAFGPGGGTNTPAHQLARLGHAAVPQLVAALDDPTFSRSVGYHRDFYFSHVVLTVGDCALQILERVAGRSVSERRTTSSYLSKDGDLAATRKAVEGWWHQVGTKGDRQVLVEAVAGGGNDAPGQARILAGKYPEAVVPALLAGIRASVQPGTRTELVQSLQRQETAEVTDFLREEMAKGPFQAARVAAAFQLRRRGETNALPTMLREWEREVDRTTGDQPATDSLLFFLASGDSPEAINRLVQNLDRKSVDTRLRVIDRVGQSPSLRANPKVKPLSDATLAAMERLLAACLEDTEERGGMSRGHKGKNFSSPRLCDMAALYLAESWPHRYAFDILAPHGERERQRIVCLNVWRRANNLPAVLPAARPSRKLAPEDATKITQVQWTIHHAEPTEALVRLLAPLPDQRLDADRLVNLLCALAAEVTPKVGGVSVKVVKDTDLTGVRVLARMAAAQRSATQTAFHTHQRVEVAGRVLTGSSSVGGVENYLKPEGWRDLRKYLNQALAASPETPFEVSVTLCWELQ